MASYVVRRGRDVIGEVEARDIRAAVREWTSREGCAADKVVFYDHGSGYAGAELATKAGQGGYTYIHISASTKVFPRSRFDAYNYVDR